MAFIAGTGRVNIDLLYRITKLPESGEEVYTNDFSLQFGGGVPASLLWLSKLGIETQLATQLGSDIFSEFAKTQLEKYGTRALLFSCDENPVNITSALILKEDRSFVTYGSNAIHTQPEEKAAMYRAFHGAKLCIMSPGAFDDVYEKLRQEGTKLLLDFGWDSEMSYEKYDKILSLADYYLPNSKEAMKLTGTGNPLDAAKALSKKIKGGVVKCDKDGAIGFKDGKLYTLPALPNTQCVDSTGAGDAFLAGFAYGLFHDYAFGDCIAFGNITGARAVEQTGALAGALREDELLSYKQNYIYAVKTAENTAE